MTLGILCSGNLGYLLLKQLLNSFEVKFIFTDSKSYDIVRLCEQQGIIVFKGNPRKGAALSFIKQNGVFEDKADVIISINYLFIIEPDLINMANKIAVNVHGSLLPKYRGRTPHVWSIINGEKYAGITAHIIDEGCDTGDIIEQVIMEIDEEDTGGSLLNKYEKHYLSLIKSVLQKIEDNNLSLVKQDNNKATYFGKRTPEDGVIDWNWQKERIRNWVRAQAHPYPGAFTYINGEKCIIDEIVYNDKGFSYEDKNGEVLSEIPLVVKTPNGCVELKAIRNTFKNKIYKGLILGL